MVRGAIDALAAEVEAEPEALVAFDGEEFPRAGRAAFVGAGDSYAAAVAGSYASRGRCIALDPYLLASAPETAEGLEVYFISASGRTASNLDAARKVRGVAKRTVALTAVAESPLAKLADRLVPLPMRYTSRTPGMLSFGLSLLAILRIAGLGEGASFDRAMANAKRDRGRLVLGKGTTYFLGNSMGHAAALYAAAKAYEVLGAKAHAEQLEEFSHLEMFSLGSGDVVNVFSCFDPSAKSEKLSRILSESGYESGFVPARGRTDVERLFHSVFAGQLSVIDAAKRAGLKRPRFLDSDRKLSASDAMIY